MEAPAAALPAPAGEEAPSGTASAGRLSLECAALSVSYGPVQALEAVNLRVQRGQVVALLGPSGSGKTTLLHAAAGFVPPASGTISIAGREVSRPGWMMPPEKRSIGLVFQSYALWPHLTARETVAYPLRRRGASRREASRAAGAWLERVGLGRLGDRRPGELSGGEQQRVGLARALAASPELFLFDEPTANLDASLKAALQREISQQRHRTGAGALYVTHDPAEALAVADVVAVLRAGRLVQEGSPQEVYSSPVDPWVASLTGACSILRGASARIDQGRVWLTLNGRDFACPGRGASRGPALLVLLRPEWVALGPPGALSFEGQIEHVRYQGAHTDYTISVTGERVLAREPGPPRHSFGAELSWQPLEATLIASDA